MRHWLIGLKDGSEKLTIPTHYKQAWRRNRLANNLVTFRGGVTGISEVYEIRDAQWGQKECELSPEEFVEWVRKTGRRIV